MSDILEKLAATLEQRKTADPGQSYVASLHEQGLNQILKKLGEEATETILAAKEAESDPESDPKSDPDSRAALIHETADLWFHSLVMLSHLEIGHEQVLEELEKRFKLSGLEEKAARGKQQGKP